MDIMVESTLGDMIVNPDVVKIIKDNGYYVIEDKVVEDFLEAELELSKLKIKIKKGELVEVNNG